MGTVSFASRFWQDGSPRLTAYEYQGLMRSKCFRAGTPGQRITCISCHEMHGGDPRGQLTEKMKTNAACTQCHEQFTKPAQLVEHTKHSAESDRQPLLQLPHASDRLRHHGRAPDARHHQPSPGRNASASTNRTPAISVTRIGPRIAPSPKQSASGRSQYSATKGGRPVLMNPKGNARSSRATPSSARSPRPP